MLDISFKLITHCAWLRSSGVQQLNSTLEQQTDVCCVLGENDIESASGGGSGADILRRLVCAVASRGVTPAGTDGTTPAHAPARHDYDPQLSTAAHTDMLLLNLMRMNGLTPKHSTSSRHGELYFKLLYKTLKIAMRG